MCFKLLTSAFLLVAYMQCIICTLCYAGKEEGMMKISDNGDFVRVQWTDFKLITIKLTIKSTIYSGIQIGLRDSL